MIQDRGGTNVIAVGNLKYSFIKDAETLKSTVGLA